MLVKALTHAGAVAFRWEPDGPRFVVVQGRRNPENWVLPKGHIDPGETPEQAAVRELREEAGVEGDVVETIGDCDVVGPRGPGYGRFYLVRRRGEVPSSEGRGIAWLSYDDARARLTFPEQRELLRQAKELLAARGDSGR